MTTAPGVAQPGGSHDPLNPVWPVTKTRRPLYHSVRDVLTAGPGGGRRAKGGSRSRAGTSGWAWEGGRRSGPAGRHRVRTE